MMSRREVFIGKNPVRENEQRTAGSFVDLDGDRFYRISHYDRMPDFFMSIVSASDLWMFISSNGALTAGRKNAENVLFPYYTEDKIHDFHGITGSRTILLAEREGRLKLWEPFSKHHSGYYRIKRNIYKNRLGNKLVFEEINEDLALAFRYGWSNSDRFGFVRNSRLVNRGEGTVEIDILDGLQNILPSGMDSAMQLGYSSLLDAYKKNELNEKAGLGIFSLSSIPVDKAEPSESLRANTVWAEGLDDPVFLLSSRQADHFRLGYSLETEHEVKGEKGAFLVNARVALSPGAEKVWNMVAEVNQDASDVARLISFLGQGTRIRQQIYDEVERSSGDLERILGSADAFQSTRDELSTARHLTNVLFNVMRGGLFEDQYLISTHDFMAFVEEAHRDLVHAAASLHGPSAGQMRYMALLERAADEGDPDLIRLCYEYLPLSFSRRHGDPSRPWNRFSIDNRKEDGTRNLDYQGNWRDIFQNWEALSLAFPEYVESMICKFVNASTADGYNPYRIKRSGIDWEVPDPSDPWSNIGYWGDHQVIYLLKLLEISVSHHPGALSQLLTQDLFTYANVPYRIKPYRELLRDPHDTIEFDRPLHDLIGERVKRLGSDGKLLWDRQDGIVRVNLAEKLLVILLAKLSSYIPGAGIWMNTQRPEWNDANNALVGHGVSMVTTAYLRAFLEFCLELFHEYEGNAVVVSEEVDELLNGIRQGIRLHLKSPGKTSDGNLMKTCLDSMGEAGSAYREKLYDRGLSGKKNEITIRQIEEFIREVLESIHLTLRASRRDDQLYHAYNLADFSEAEGIKLRRLYVMLEGQVAMLASGFLAPAETADLLDQLKRSPLYRRDQNSYILYPDRRLPLFTEKNLVSPEMMRRSRLLQELVGQGNGQIVRKDVNGVCHFNGNFRNAGMLKDALDNLPGEYRELAEKDKQVILEIYEEIFDHQSFTGRSGTFFGYEGLGSIYWHMVSKLLLSVCDSCYRARDENADRVVLERLAGHYYQIREGIGVHKNPGLYGAFPTDPYSHTPGHRGAQQPGMTGQVKEDIIARWGELGIRIRGGCIQFHPVLLRREEFHTRPGEFVYVDPEGTRKTIATTRDSLAFTYCQVPVVYHRSGQRKIKLHFSDETGLVIDGDTIDRSHSAMIFSREGTISRIDVWLEPQL